MNDEKYPLSKLMFSESFQEMYRHMIEKRYEINSTGTPFYNLYYVPDSFESYYATKVGIREYQQWLRSEPGRAIIRDRADRTKRRRILTTNDQQVDKEEKEKMKKKYIKKKREYFAEKFKGLINHVITKGRNRQIFALTNNFDMDFKCSKGFSRTLVMNIFDSNVTFMKEFLYFKNREMGLNSEHSIYGISIEIPKLNEHQNKYVCRQLINTGTTGDMYVYSGILFYKWHTVISNILDHIFTTIREKESFDIAPLFPFVFDNDAWEKKSDIKALYEYQYKYSNFGATQKLKNIERWIKETKSPRLKAFPGWDSLNFQKTRGLDSDNVEFHIDYEMCFSMFPYKYIKFFFLKLEDLIRENVNIHMNVCTLWSNDGNIPLTKVQNLIKLDEALKELCYYMGFFEYIMYSTMFLEKRPNLSTGSTEFINSVNKYLNENNEVDDMKLTQITGKQNSRLADCLFSLYKTIYKFNISYKKIDIGNYQSFLQVTRIDGVGQSPFANLGTSNSNILQIPNPIDFDDISRSYPVTL